MSSCPQPGPDRDDDNDRALASFCAWWAVGLFGLFFWFLFYDVMRGLI